MAQSDTLLSIVAIGGILLVLYIASKSARSAALVMANLPARAYRWRCNGLPLRRHPFHRLSRGFHHAIRNRHAKRNHAYQLLFTYLKLMPTLALKIRGRPTVVPEKALSKVIRWNISRYCYVG